MVSILALILSIIASASIGFIAGVFVYRNNTRILGGIADKVDTIKDTVEGENKS